MHRNARRVIIMSKDNKVIFEYKIKNKPNYIPQGDEENIFMHAWKQRIPLILKGPTGCGKTRFYRHGKRRELLRGGAAFHRYRRKDSRN